MAKKGQKFRKYTKEEKLKAVKRVLEEGESQMQVERDILGTTNCTGTLNRWIREYLQEAEDKAWTKKRGRKKFEEVTPENVRYEILKKFNAFLSKEINTNINSSKNKKKDIQSNYYVKN